MKIVSWDPSVQLSERAEQAQRQSSSQRALQGAAEEFESLFLQQMLQNMRNTVPESDLLGDRSAEKTFQYLLDEEMSRDMAKSGGIGLADMLYKQMIHFVPDND